MASEATRDVTLRVRIDPSEIKGGLAQMKGAVYGYPTFTSDVKFMV